MRRHSTPVTAAIQHLPSWRRRGCGGAAVGRRWGYQTNQPTYYTNLTIHHDRSRWGGGVTGEGDTARRSHHTARHATISRTTSFPGGFTRTFHACQANFISPSKSLQRRATRGTAEPPTLCYVTLGIVQRLQKDFPCMSNHPRQHIKGWHTA